MSEMYFPNREGTFSFGERDLPPEGDLVFSLDDNGYRVPWVYAHGTLEDTLGNDIIYVIQGRVTGETLQPCTVITPEGETACVLEFSRPHGFETGLVTIKEVV